MLRRFRLTFLAKFTFVTFVLAVVITTALGTLLVNEHRNAVENDQAASAAGQASALATTALYAMRDGSPQQLAALRSADVAAQRIPAVVALRIYHADGRALYPSRSASDREDVTFALQHDDVTSRIRGDLRSVYVPFATGRAPYVLTVDLSRAAVAAKLNDERRFVSIATLISIGLIFFSLVALAAGASRELERRRREAERTFVQTLGLLAHTIDKRDPYTAGHSRRVADYSGLLVDALGYDARLRETVTNAALLHDLGKIGIPDAVLLKPGRLDDEERAVITRHPVIGAELLEGIAAMEHITPCVLHHHERVDGAGYPNGLLSEQIPLGSRIIAVTDAFDAMTTDRPYRAALELPIAIAELRRVAGTQLETRMVEAFIGLIETRSVIPPPSLLREVHAGSMGEPLRA